MGFLLSQYFPAQTSRPEPVDTTEGRDFSLIVLPDTQMYSEFYPDIFCQQTQWIVDNKERLNIQFVSQLGDIVNSGGQDPKQWQVASDCISTLEGQVAFGLAPGNHDVDEVGAPDSNFTTYNSTFPLRRFYLYPWYRGNYLENQNSYQVIHAAGEDFLFLHLEVDAPDDVLSWANQVLQQHQDKKAIVSTHIYLEDGTGERKQSVHYRTGNNSAEAIWQKLISQNCNVFLVLSGHFHQGDGENQLDSTNVCGQTVHQVVQDYQDREEGGNGRLRIYTFRPLQRVIDVQTYSPTTQTFEVDEDSQFTLPY